jgi:hypothetical protein
MGKERFFALIVGAQILLVLQRCGLLADQLAQALDEPVVQRRGDERRRFRSVSDWSPVAAGSLFLGLARAFRTEFSI